MSYSEELRAFAATHTYKDIKVDGSTFHYVLSGKKGGKTLILLNGGMNTLEMWMRYIDALSDTYQVLLFNYPQEIRTNQELVKGMHVFFERLGIKEPVFIGAMMAAWLPRSIRRRIRGKLGGLFCSQQAVWMRRR